MYQFSSQTILQFIGKTYLHIVRYLFVDLLAFIRVVQKINNYWLWKNIFFVTLPF